MRHYPSSGEGEGEGEGGDGRLLNLGLAAVRAANNWPLNQLGSSTAYLETLTRKV